MANILKLHINEVKNKSGNSTIKLTIIKNIIKTEFFITLSFIFLFLCPITKSINTGSYA